jgi:beta-lactam-binding protein with PASTA domain
MRALRIGSVVVASLLLVAVVVGCISRPSSAKVPDLRGLSRTESVAVLKALGLTLGAETEESSSDSKAGTVLSQTPAAGAEAAPGSGVDVVIATEPAQEPSPPPAPVPAPKPVPVPSPAPAPTNLVKVPDVVKAVQEHDWASTYEDDPAAFKEELTALVEGELEAVGLRGVVKLRAIGAGDDQSPEAGTMAKKDTLVTVYIGVGD